MVEHGPVYAEPCARDGAIDAPDVRPRVATARRTEVLRAPPEALSGMGEVRFEADLQEESVVLRRPGYLPGVEVWGVSASSRHWVKYDEQYCFCGGDASSRDFERMWNTTECRGVVHPMSGPGMMATGPARLTRMTKISGKLYFHAIQVRPDVAREWLPRGSELDFRGLADPRQFQSFTRAWQAVEAQDLDVTEQEHHLRSFLGSVFSAATGGHLISPRECRNAVRRAREFLHDRHTDSITLGDVASEVGCSVWHLERSFSAAFGVPLHTYLQHVRVARAMTLLRGGGRASMVAAATGFADQAHLTRTFRKCLGITPRVFQGAAGSPRRARRD